MEEAIIPPLPQQVVMLNKVLYASIGADGASQVGVNFGKGRLCGLGPTRRLVDRLLWTCVDARLLDTPCFSCNLKSWSIISLN